MSKWLKRLSWLISIAFVVVVIFPLSFERFVSGNDWKSLFCSFQLSDEDGKLHTGFFHRQDHR
jgi:hypothetical protein